MGDDTPSDYMGGDGADNEHKEQKHNEAKPRALSGSDIPREVLDYIVECVKECGKDQECDPGRQEN
jgi:hypothetical protein